MEFSCLFMLWLSSFAYFMKLKWALQVNYFSSFSNFISYFICKILSHFCNNIFFFSFLLQSIIYVVLRGFHVVLMLIVNGVFVKILLRGVLEVVVVVGRNISYITWVQDLREDRSPLIVYSMSYDLVIVLS